MALTRPKPPAFNIEHRRAERVEVSFRSVLRHGAKSVRVHVVDISPLGLCARWERCDSAGLVKISLPFIGPVAARIVWVLGGRIGAEFIEPIDLAQYHNMLAAAPRQSPWHD